MATSNPLPPAAARTTQPPANPRHRRPRKPRNPVPQRENGVELGGSSDHAAATTQLAEPVPQASLALRPVSVAPSPQSGSVEVSSAGQRRAQPASSRRDGAREPVARNGGGQPMNQSSNGGRGSRGGARPRRPGHATQGGPVTTSTGRRFGGQLTNDIGPGASTTTTSLQASAPEFQPQQTTSASSSQPGPTSNRRPPPRSKNEPNPRQTPRQRRSSKSSAADIATRTHEDITNGVYECPICVNEVARNSKVWSCKTCWTVFHLGCIKKWSKNEGAAQTQQQLPNGEMPPPRQWRCPGCNLPTEAMPSNYSCWCEKEIDPKAFPGLPPHSCGQTCGKARVLPKACPHPCDMVCHAGPCPPCTHTGPKQSCFCGAQSSTKRCVDTDYARGWSCGKPCGNLMPCGIHTCQQGCHDGSCGACEMPVPARCYCGSEEKDVLCCEAEGAHENSVTNLNASATSTIDHWTGLYKCRNGCGRSFDCGVHKCSKACHVQDALPAHCPLSPDVITHCPCGQTPLSVLTPTARTTCSDPVPHCAERCQKMLPCGHLCQQPCHSDECLPCMATIDIPCRCGRVVSSSVCHRGSEERPWCSRVCRTTLNCGRHECSSRCCPGERRASERHSSKRKPRPLESANSRSVLDSFEAEHICTRVCGRPLKCGNHSCPELCHKGACGSCREAIFDELSCHCGRSVLQPPLPCGTLPPPCRFDCDRQKPCSHPQTSHNCHLDSESCPKCPFLTSKACMCGKRVLKNQQCWLTDVRCGEPCGEMLRCGSHNCRKQCHRPGECEDALGSPCQQRCGKAKKVCSHACEEPCHAPYPCREEKPCTHKDLITCACQHLKQEVRCGASKTREGNMGLVLPCDDECLRLERNRKLALALEIDPATHDDPHIPYSKETLSLFQEAPKWSQAQERILRVFAADETEKRLRFKPMPPQQRAFLHALAEDYGLDSESMDPEPHRHVAVFKTPKFVSAPLKTLGQCATSSESATASDSVSKADPTAAMASKFSGSPFNALLLSGPRFGLEVAEIYAAFSGTFDDLAPGLAFGIQAISFLPSEEIVIKPAAPASSQTTQDERALEAQLRGLQPAIVKTCAAAKPPLAALVQLCRADASLNIVRREADEGSLNGFGGASGGWSQVAAKAAVRGARAPEKPMVGGGGGFMVLGRRPEAKASAEKLKKKKAPKPEKVEVVEDWMEAEEQEERRERIVGGDGAELKAVTDEHEMVGEGRTVEAGPSTSAPVTSGGEGHAVGGSGAGSEGASA